MLSRPPGSAGALRAARLPGMVLDDGRVVVVDAAGDRAGSRRAVEEGRGGGLAPAARPRLDVLADAREGRGIVQAGCERGQVEPELARVAEEALPLEVLVVLEEDVVVLPEPLLPGGALRRARGEAGGGMERPLHVAVAARVEREVPEDQAHVGARAHQLVQVAGGLHAETALEVGELDDGERRPGPALAMAVGAGELAQRADGEARVPAVEPGIARLHVRQAAPPPRAARRGPGAPRD